MYFHRHLHTLRAGDVPQPMHADFQVSGVWQLGISLSIGIRPTYSLILKSGVVMNQYLANNVWLKVPAKGVYFVPLIRTTHTASFNHIFLGFLVRHLAINEFLPDFCLWLSVCFSDLRVSGP